ncbi:MAG TPA: stage III sporulation protein AE [Bacillota bacterium]|nr:stage III sporulation protein AE [Bacillota bacterium]
MIPFNKITFSLSLCIIIFFFPIDTLAQSEDNDLDRDEFIDAIDTGEVEAFWNQLVYEYGSYLPEVEHITFRSLLNETDNLSVKNIVTNLFTFAFQEIMFNGKLLSMLLILAIFSSILQTIHSAFETSTVSKIAYFIIFLVLFYLAINSFKLTITYMTSTIQIMSDFILAIVPLLLGLLASIGNLLSVSFIHPLIIFAINIINVLTTTFIVPLLILSFLLMMVSYINKQYQVTYLAKLFRNISLGALGVFSTVFISMMTIQGTASAVQDGLALKTAKFVTGNFIPVIGRTFTDAVDIVLNISLTLKNTIGIIGVVMIILFAIFPMIKILIIAFMYKLAAAIIQPIGEQAIVKTLNSISNYTLYILACLAMITFMFFLSIVIIIVSSNVTMFIK